MVTAMEAYGHSLLCSLIYVLSLYVFVSAELRALPRDHLQHIRARLIAVSIATTLVLLRCVYFLHDKNPWQHLSALSTLGLRVDMSVLTSLWRTAALMAVFYAGSILTFVLFTWTKLRYDVNYDGALHPRDKPASLVTVVVGDLTNEFESMPKIVLLRNLVVAPVTEEVVFRAALLPVLCLHFLANPSPDSSSWLSPYATVALCSTLWFGVAHAHHLIEKLRQGVQVVPAVAGTLVQLTYTSIFGYIAALLFMRTGNVFAPILSHMICNFVGLPDVGCFSVAAAPTSCLHKYRVLIAFVHLAGLLAFSFCIMWWTEDLAQVSVFWNPLP